MCHIFIKIIFRSINVKKIIKSRDFFIREKIQILFDNIFKLFAFSAIFSSVDQIVKMK